MESQQFVFDAIGTKWVIDIYSSFSKKKVEQIEEVIKICIEDFDKIYSRFRKDSLVYKISQKAGKYKIFDNSLIGFYKKLYELTGGLFTPTIGNLITDAGYDSKYSLKPKKLKKVPSWEKIIYYESGELTVKKPVILDFGAVGKGYLVDRIGTILEKNRIQSYCIDAGGDILQKSESDKALKIGLEHPENLNQAIGTVELLNKSICASSGNRRKWDKFHHILNPKTQESVNEILSVWVIADTATIADGLATALFFASPDVFEKDFDFEYLILYPDYTIKKSVGFLADLYYNN